MSSLRLWAGILFGVSFAAGLATGLLAAGPTAARIDPGPFGDYRRLLSSMFSLDQERENLLFQLLRIYHRDIEDVQQRHLGTYMSAMEPELERLGARYHDLIRNYVLPEDRRPEFDRRIQGTVALAVN